MESKIDEKIMISQETDEDLLIYISMKKEDPVSANIAFNELYYRHAKYLYNILIKQEPSLLRSGEINDLLQDTFLRVYEKAGTFKSTGVKSHKEAEAIVRAWMGRIAINIFLERCRQKKKNKQEYPDNIEWEDIPSRPGSVNIKTEEKQIIEKALYTLSERDKAIILASFQYYDFEEGDFKIPKEELNALCDRFQTTRDNIRQIRKRALQKIKEYANAPL